MREPVGEPTAGMGEVQAKEIVRSRSTPHQGVGNDAKDTLKDLDSGRLTKNERNIDSQS